MEVYNAKPRRSSSGVRRRRLLGGAASLGLVLYPGVASAGSNLLILLSFWARGKLQGSSEASVPSSPIVRFCDITSFILRVFSDYI